MKNKRSAKILSLILALVMAFSLVPVSAFAATVQGDGTNAGGWWNGGHEGWGNLPDPGELPDVELDPDVNYPAFDLTETVDGLTVTAEIPEGALPEGTEMTVTPVNLEAVQSAVDSSDEVSGTVLAAADITFRYEGGIIQPGTQIHITMNSEALAEAENTSVVHLDTTAEALEDADVLPEPVDNVTVGTHAVTFGAEHFSVYAVVEGDEIVTPRYTYNFVGGDGEPYEFTNKVGQTVTSQIVKNGEWLEKIPAPGLYQNQAFVMWVYDGGELDGQEVKFGEENPITVGNEDKTFTVKAYYGSVIYVTFWQYARDKDTEGVGNVVLERKQIAKNSEGKYVMNMADVTVPAPKPTLKFMGWSLTPGSDSSEENGDTPNSRPLLDNGNVEFTKDTDVYPVYYSGLWIVFVSAGTGMGATYVDSYFITADSTSASAAKPTDPTMTGYAFDGWVYNTPDSDYTAAESSSNFFNFNTSYDDLVPLMNARGEVVLYGHWKGGNTTYVVVYWKQNVNDDKSAATKTYDYAGQTEPITATTGSVPTPTAAQQKADFGFKYARYELVDVDDEGNTTASTGIKANGSSILNVYFDRKLIYLKFYRNGNSTSAPGYDSTYYGTTTGNTRVTVMSGLYGQPLSKYNYTWPSDYRWTFYTTNNETQGMVYLGQFVLPDNVRDTNYEEMRMYYSGDPSVTYTFYLQDANGNYPTTGMPTGSGGTGGFYFSDKYDGFKVVAYRFERNGSYYAGQRQNYADWGWDYRYGPASSSTSANNAWTTVTSTGTTGNHTYTPEIVYPYRPDSYNVYNIQVRYEREKYQILYLNPLNEDPVLAPKETLFGATLTSVKPTATSIDLGVPGYEWDGKWYKDKNCTEEFNFDTETMPMGGTKVYAGKTPIYFYIKIDPNGGQLQTGQSTWRWVLYGDDSTYTYDNIERNYIDYKGTGTAYYYYYDEFDTSRRDDIWNYVYMAANPRTAYYTSNTVPDDWDQVLGGNTIHHNGSEAQQWLNTTKKYSYEADAYALIGWYDVTDGVENMKPFKTGTAIHRDTIIQAQWRRTGEYRVIYSVEAVDKTGAPLMTTGETPARVMGSDSPVDGAKYADKSDSAIMDKMAGVPAGYVFLGWWYNGKMYEPGDVFQVLASISDDNKCVYVYPVLEPVESTPVPVIDLTYHLNGGAFTDDADDQLNAIIQDLIDADPGTKTTYSPELVNGVDEDGQPTKGIKNMKINEAFKILNAAAVEKGIVVNDQVQKGRGYRLAGWCTTKDGTGTFFPVGTTIGVDDKEQPNNTVPNNLWAMWDELVYVYHSADNTVEEFVVKAYNQKSPNAMPDRVKMTKGYDTENNTFTSYYYSGFALYAGNNAVAEGLNFNNGTASVQTPVAASFWTRKVAARSATIWTGTQDLTGTVLYLKETSTAYLAQPKVSVIKEQWGEGPITSINYVTVTDTNIYRAAGVVINDSQTKGTFSKSYTMIQNPKTEGNTETPDSMFGLEGYLSVVTAPDLDTGSRVMRGYWITYDQVTVNAIDSSEKTINIQ